MDYISAGLSLPLRDNLGLNAEVRQEKGNLELAPELLSAPIDKYNRLGLDYKLKTNTTVSIDWRQRSRRDRLPDSAFNYSEETLGLTIGHSFKKIILYASAESGTKRDKLNNSSTHLQRYTVSGYFKPYDNQSYSGYLYYDESSFTDQKNRGITTGLNSSFQIGRSTSLYLNLQSNNYEKSYSGNRDIIEIKLSHTLSDKNKVLVHGRHTSYRNSNEIDKSTLMLEYTVAFGLPVSRKKSVGMVKGYVYDEETSEAISNVILRLDGATAVTDENGRFSFPSLGPGTYHLNIYTAGIGLNKITTRRTPLELTVEGGKEAMVNIGITRAAAISGRIMLYRLKNKHNNNTPGNTNTDQYVAGKGVNNNTLNGETEAVEAYGLKNILVELRNGPEIKRRVTGRDGSFEFEALRPGKWTLKIHGANLPAYHYLEKDTFEFKLKPNEKKEVPIKILPLKRSIHIIENAGTLMEEKNKNN